MLVEQRTEPSVLWRRCRESLGIARLLVNEKRPAPFVETACHLAVENGCRAALALTGRSFDGDVRSALLSLEAPDELLAEPGADLAKAERAVGWLAEHLKNRIPDRVWGY